MQYSRLLRQTPVEYQSMYLGLMGIAADSRWLWNSDHKRILKKPRDVARAFRLAVHKYWVLELGAPKNTGSKSV